MFLRSGMMVVAVIAGLAWLGAVAWMSTDGFDQFLDTGRATESEREPAPRQRPRDDRGSASPEGSQTRKSARGRETGKDRRETRKDGKSRPPSPEPAERIQETLSGALQTTGRIAHVTGLGLMALGLVLLLFRWPLRRMRRYVRLTLVPYRAEEEASPEDVQRMFETWHQQLLEPWWWRPVRGQRGIALEVAMVDDGQGNLAGQLSIVCPEKLANAIEGALMSCYPDSRLTRGGALPPVRRLLRLEKRYRFVRALGSLDNQRHSLIDATLQQMAALGEPAIVQFALTPTPAVFDRVARAQFRSQERRSEAVRGLDKWEPGLRSAVLARELEGGLRVQHRPLFFADIRVAGPSRRHCKAIAGVLRGQSNAENRLVVRHVIVRSGYYLSRVQAGIANPIPSLRRGVLSSIELAALWHLPSPALKGVRLARTAVPRLLAPPEVTRAPEHALMRDEDGPVGIRPEDKSDGLGLIGGQKTGKTSVLCRTVQADALDPDCALVVLMPKPGDALKALSMVPKERTVHYLDLERPEFGINPLTAPGDTAMVADKIVDAFRDVNVEGDIRGSSDRFLRQAAQAAIGASRTGVVDGPPTLWHMYRILMPAEHAFRDRVVESLSLDPSYADTATFFGRELPSDLEHSPGQTSAKLDAPRNKILRLLVESLDKVLRHPIQLDLDEIVRRREVLVVDGKMGTFGADNCRVMMQFILSALYGALRRQQEIHESERVRVALKVDEAHLILNDSFADAMATLRSGGLEVVAAWQYGAQIQDRKIRGGMMSLLRQRCMFSMGETEDAREMSSLAMAVFSDMIRDSPDSRARMRVTPDTIFNLPNYHSVCSWISRGARVPAFLGQSLPLEYDEDVVMHHAERQRERGGHVPERLPDPLPDLDWKGHRELPTEVLFEAGTSNGAGSSNGAHSTNGVPSTNGADASSEADTAPVHAAAVALDFDAAASSVDDSAQRSNVRPPAELPDTYAELDLEDVYGLAWDNVTPIPADRRHDPSARELHILEALWTYRFLFATQIHRRWWRGSSLRAAQQTLNKMTKAGWVRRFKLQVRERGAQQRVYCLTRQGFELAQEHVGRRGHYIDPEATWREPVVADARRILRSLHVNGWALAFDARVGKALRAWRGPGQSRLKPPNRRVRGQWIEVAPHDIVIGASHKLRDYEPHKFEPVSPDATLELELSMGEGRLCFDLLLEFDRARSAAASEERLRRYDGLISGWSGMLDRYKALGTPPVAVFVCEDERAAISLLKIADRAVTARLAKPGTEQTEWPHPARRGMFFVVERDVHVGSLKALMLPEHPPELRVALHGRRAKACQPRRVNLIEPGLLDVA